ncbi:MAG TPA: membrane dipeptidase, partial [Blastocatellia bacterium]
MMLSCLLRPLAASGLALTLAAATIATDGSEPAPRTPKAEAGRTDVQSVVTASASRSGSGTGAPDDDAALRARAEKLHRESIVVDTHNDITTPMLDEDFDIGGRGDDPDGKVKTHTDLRRMKAGGLTAEFFSIYVDHLYIDKKPSEGGPAARRALDMIDTVYQQVKRHPDQIEMAYTAEDIRRAKREGKIAALMGIEGGHAIEDSLHSLRMFYKLGVRYMTLTH